MEESTPSKGPITRAGSSGLAQMRFVATGPNGSSEAESPIRPVAPTRYRKATALLMSGTRISMRPRSPLKVPPDGRLLLRTP
jgi:hypothetical protein